MNLMISCFLKMNKRVVLPLTSRAATCRSADIHPMLTEAVKTQLQASNLTSPILDALLFELRASHESVRASTKRTLQRNEFGCTGGASMKNFTSVRSFQRGRWSFLAPPLCFRSRHHVESLSCPFEKIDKIGKPSSRIRRVNLPLLYTYLLRLSILGAELRFPFLTRLWI